MDGDKGRIEDKGMRDDTPTLRDIIETAVSFIVFVAVLLGIQ